LSDTAKDAGIPESNAPGGIEPDGYSFTTDDGEVKLSEKEIRELHKDYHNNTNWKNTNRLESETLNKQKKDFEAQKEEQERQYSERMQKLINSEKDFTGKVAQEKQKTENDLIREFAEGKLAIAELTKKYEDFDHAEILKHYKNYDNKTQIGAMEHAYLAWKGAQVDELIADARANVVRDARRKKGLPPTGKKESAPIEGPPQTLQESSKALLRKLGKE